LAAESTEVGGLNCTDVAFGGDRVVRKGIALRIETHTHKPEQLYLSQKDTLPAIPSNS